MELEFAQNIIHQRPKAVIKAIVKCVERLMLLHQPIVICSGIWGQFDIEHRASEGQFTLQSKGFFSSRVG